MYRTSFNVCGLHSGCTFHLAPTCSADSIVRGLGFSSVLLPAGLLLGSQRRFVAFLLSIACIAVYTVQVGASTSAGRAVLMDTLSLFARRVGNRQDRLNSRSSSKIPQCCLSSCEPDHMF